jgi:hypothetical protein
VLRHWNTALDSWGGWAHLVEVLVPVKEEANVGSYWA